LTSNFLQLRVVSRKNKNVKYPGVVLPFYILLTQGNIIKINTWYTEQEIQPSPDWTRTRWRSKEQSWAPCQSCSDPWTSCAQTTPNNQPEWCSSATRWAEWASMSLSDWSTFWSDFPARRVVSPRVPRTTVSSAGFGDRQTWCWLPWLGAKRFKNIYPTILKIASFAFIINNCLCLRQLADKRKLGVKKVILFCRKINWLLNSEFFMPFKLTTIISDL